MSLEFRNLRVSKRAVFREARSQTAVMTWLSVSVASQLLKLSSRQQSKQRDKDAAASNVAYQPATSTRYTDTMFGSRNTRRTDCITTQQLGPELWWGSRVWARLVLPSAPSNRFLIWSVKRLAEPGGARRILRECTNCIISMPSCLNRHRSQSRSSPVTGL